ncbi:MAG: TraB/GumN family protein, partial [Alphaproteobacteria bacterium]|nr:TraB/GumN family protein [Alphaproteobacteria bacterium]
LMQQEGLGQHLLYKRNQDWAHKMSLLLNKPGRFFVAVGTAHLVGDQSVIAILVESGAPVLRTQ